MTKPKRLVTNMRATTAYPMFFCFILAAAYRAHTDHHRGMFWLMCLYALCALVCFVAACVDVYRGVDQEP